MSILKFLISIGLAAATLTAAHAERRCPANVDSVPLRQIHGALIVVPVIVNGRGPFDFLVDSGAQITTVDTQLAAQLALPIIGSAGISGVGTHQRQATTRLDHVQIGAHQIGELLAVVDDMAQLIQADPKLRGIIGENFLAHFDFLIDNRHRALCLDESGAMAAAIKGLRLPFAQPSGPNRDLGSTPLIVIATQLDGTSTPTFLCLDSGSNAAVLFASSQAAQARPVSGTRTLKSVVAGTGRSFTRLPPWQVSAGGRTLGQIAFVLLSNAARSNSADAAVEPRMDGLLPTAVFQSVFVSYRSGFAILEPK